VIFVAYYSCKQVAKCSNGLFTERGRRGALASAFLFGALAECEREIIRERTMAGLSSARSRGRAGGRSKALTPKQVQMLKHMAADKSLTVSDICKTLGIGRTTFYRYAKANEK
jgi:DNA invertase Pin-like site-specific DNA recombinase